MNIAKLSDLIGIINKIAPQHLAAEWDNPGLQVGDPAAAIERIMVALDPGQAAVEAAIAAGCNLLLTHHPLIFKSLKRISGQEPTGALILRAISSNLAIAALHTNYDVADDGVNDLLAARLGVTDCQPLTVSDAEELVKLSVFVPHGHEEQVMEALFRFTGVLGNYGDCSFRVAGIGTFRPLPGARPFIGTVGQREEVGESRLEVLLRRAELTAALKVLTSVHPYEEPAYDLYPVLNRGSARGLGRIGRLSAPLSLAEYAGLVKDRLGAAGVRIVGPLDNPVHKVALCGGSGASLLRGRLPAREQTCL